MQLITKPRPMMIHEKRENLFMDLALIHSLSKIIQISYYNTLKGTNFSKPKIKSKANQIENLSEDIIKSIGDAVRLKEDMADYMEYEHFTEVYELLKTLVFKDTEFIKELTKLINKPNEQK